MMIQYEGPGRFSVPILTEEMQGRVIGRGGRVIQQIARLAERQGLHIHLPVMNAPNKLYVRGDQERARKFAEALDQLVESGRIAFWRLEQALMLVEEQQDDEADV